MPQPDEQRSAANRQEFTVAALFVETGGVYFNVPGVDPWDEQRDARLYDGPYPVVAHPPCGRWGRMANVNLKRWGTPIGSDDGCFRAALTAVETYGGVLEHPAYSQAWNWYDLPKPKSRGGWTARFGDIGYSIEVAQSAYGHAAQKRTWLYAVDCELPELTSEEPRGSVVIGAGINSGECQGRRMDDRLTEATPLEFRDLLLGMARSVYASRSVAA